MEYHLKAALLGYWALNTCIRYWGQEYRFERQTKGNYGNSAYPAVDWKICICRIRQIFVKFFSIG